MAVFRDRRRNNVWSYDFQLDRQRHQGVCYRADGTPARSEREARDIEGDIRATIRKEKGIAKGIQPGSFTLAQAILRHTSSASVDCTASHIASMQRIGNELMRYFGADTPVVDISDDDIAGPPRLGRRIAPSERTPGYRIWCAAQQRKVWLGGPRKITDADYDNPDLWKMLDRPRSPSEVNHCLDLLRCALQAAHKTRNPRTGESQLPFPPEVKPVFDPERDPRPMPEAEFNRRKERAPQWTREGALLARYYGLRKTEVVTVGLEHLDHENCCLRLPGSMTKSGKDQALYGGDRGWVLLLWLARQARRRGQTRLITWPGRFWYKRMRLGERPPADVWVPLKTFRTSWRESAKGVADPHRFHDVRAAYITSIARLGSTAITKGLARHASIVTTEKYIKIVQDDLAQAADKAAKSRPRLKVVR